MEEAQSEKLRISSAVREGFPVVTVSGEIDLYTAPRFSDALAEASGNAAALIVDLSTISYIDSAGLSALLAVFRRLSSRGASLYVISPPNNPGVRRVMEVTRLDSLISVRPTLEDALKELRVKKAA